ncbi:MAG: DUF1844 domain-containing protein [Candidatus Omnitrophica bacterium]|nr:DUF1844 domain-containing protein [Candidatus Omnitrophota bacterium]
MSEAKDIRFTQKKVDENWKESIEKDKGTPASTARLASPSRSPEKMESEVPGGTTKATSKAFMQLVSSLGYQALMHLGEVDPGGMGQAQVDLDAAREVIDLLASLKEKTQGNLSSEEHHLLETILPELQMKFVSKS